MRFYGKSAKFCLIIYSRKEIRAKFLLNLLFSKVSVSKRIILLLQRWSYWLTLYIFHNFAKIYSFSAIIILDIKYSRCIFFFYPGFLSGTFTNHWTAGEGEGHFMTPYYHFHPLSRHLVFSRAITAENSPLHIGSSQTRTGNLWVQAQVISNCGNESIRNY